MPILHGFNDEEARKQSGKLPYRLLEANLALSYGDEETENMIIYGDNLEALKALLPYYAEQVKCI
jgi:adenine-specific DNA-methyltransferase